MNLKTISYRLLYFLHRTTNLHEFSCSDSRGFAVYFRICYGICWISIKTSDFIWKIADLLRGDYKQSEYGDVILPFTVLCRLDRVLKDTHDAVVAENKRIRYKNKAPFLTAISKRKFYNVSEFTFESLTSDSGLIRDNLIDYIKGFSENARTILESFDIYPKADICLDKDGNPEPAPDLRDTEQIPVKQDIEEYIRREVLPYVPDAWENVSKQKRAMRFISTTMRK